MTTNNISTTDRQGFAALVDAYYAAHTAYNVQVKAGNADAAFDAFIDARNALLNAPAPDLRAIHEKAMIMAHDTIDGDNPGPDGLQSIIGDIAKLRGAPAFDAADWLYRWTEFRGGYVVQGGKVNLVTPADEYCPLRCALIDELDAKQGREALSAYILDDQPADQWKALCAAFDDIAAKLDATDLDDDTIDQLADDRFNALTAMMTYPAPDASALAYKLEAFKAEGCGGLDEKPQAPILDALAADARRLAS